MPIDDSFPGPDLNQDPSVVSWQWVKQMDDPNGLFVSTGNYPYLLTWTLPDTGFVIQTSSNLEPNSWTDPGATNIFNLGSSKEAFIPSSGLSSSSAGYFRLKQQ